MAKPLFSPTEEDDYRAEMRRPCTNEDWKTFYAQNRAKEQAHLIETNKRAQARPVELLNALIILVGNRGAKYIEFDDVFALSDSEEVVTEVEKTNTPETRRQLYTILKALTEIPKTWAASAFLRFLRGTGKQKDAKYHGAGSFGVLYGWKEEEVKNIVQVIADSESPYSKVLMSYANTYQEIRDAEDAGEDYEYGTEFKATRVERDYKFIERLCGLLEKQGLGPIPIPAEEKPKKARKIKQFVPGDIVKKTNLRDLPLPAKVRLTIERYDENSKIWLESTMDIVVTSLTNTGRFTYAIVPDGKTAYFENYRYGRSKRELEGATFLGKFDGELSKKEITVRYLYRVKLK